MRILSVALFFLFLLLPFEVQSSDFHGRQRISSYNNRINVYHYDGSRGTYSRRGSSNIRRNFGPILPSGNILGPFKNPDSDARKPENLTACIYDAFDVLVYEREGKVCPYKYVDQNKIRVERRRQEWLKLQANDRNNLMRGEN